MEIIQIYLVLNVFVIGMVHVNTSFTEIFKISEEVIEQTSFTTQQALKYLKELSRILQHDLQTHDEDLACSVIQGKHSMQPIVDYFEYSDDVDDLLIDITGEMTKVTEIILRGIGETFCPTECNVTCPMTMLLVRPIVFTLEDTLLRMLRVITDRLNREIVEINEHNLTISVQKVAVQDIFNTEKFMNHIVLPRTAENLAASVLHSGMTVWFMDIFTTENLYTFLSDNVEINAGILKTFMQDANSENVNIFETVEFSVNVVKYMTDPDGLKQSSSVDPNQLTAHFDFGNESGMASVVLNSLRECTSVISADTDFQIITTGIDIINVDESPDSYDVSFEQQALILFRARPNPPMDITVNCQECLEQADIVFIIDASTSVGQENFDAMKSFIVALINQFDVGPSNVRIGVVMYSTDSSIIFYLTTYSNKNDVITAVNGISFARGLSNAGKAMQDVRVKLFTPLNDRGHSVKRMAIFLAEGPSDDSDDLKDEASLLKDEGVDVVCVGIDNYSQEELSAISSDPDTAHIFTVTEFQYLKNLTASMFQEMCGGLVASTSAMRYKHEQVKIYVMNEVENKWDVSSVLKPMKIDGNNLVFESNFFGSFGGSILAPEVIDFAAVFTNFDDKIAENPYVLTLNCTLLVSFVLGILFLRRLDQRDTALWLYKQLVGNRDNAKYSYYISIKTGIWSSNPLSSVAYIIIKGVYGETECRPIVEQSGKVRGLLRWKSLNFLLKTDTFLGPITEVKIWHDNAGERNNLFLNRMLISTGKPGNTYTFLCNDWLSDSKGDGLIYRRLYSAQDELKDGTILFSSAASSRLFDDHLFLSVISRPSFSKFTRVQRLTCVTSMIALSFLVSAMFFRLSEDTNTHGVKIGPIKVTYVQIYVGLVSSLITAPVGISVGYIFRNRRFKKDAGNENVPSTVRNDGGTLPWYFIFVGYGIAILGLLSGMFFTLLYSLQWGSATSRDWMMSICLGTTNGIVLFDPVKVVLFALVVALIFKSSARNDILNMAPFYIAPPKPRKRNAIPIPAVWPGDDKETNAKKKMRQQVILDKKLSMHFLGLLVKLMTLALLFLISSHFWITESYLQNTQLINQLKPAKKINVSDDVWDWLYDKYLPNVLPRRLYNGDVKTPDDMKFMSDRFSYRMGPIRLRQIRTKGNCDIPNVMRNVVMQCSQELTTETEETGNFCPGWRPYSRRCEKTGFSYSLSNDTGSFPRMGEYDTYGGGGFVKDLDPDIDNIYYEVISLKRKNWIDNRTRFISVENVVFNINTKIFSMVTSTIEIPIVGGYYMDIHVKSSRLYPYIHTLDFLVLVGQVIFVLLTLVKTVYFIYETTKLKTKCFTSLTSWITVVDILLSYTTIGCYIARIDRTIVIVEEIFNSTNKFVSFELVQLLDEIYKGCLAVVIFIAITVILPSLSFNFHIYMAKAAMGLARTDMLSFIVVLMITLTGFSSYIYCTMGAHSYELRDFFRTFLTLFRIMLAVTTFRDASFSDNAQTNALFSFFTFIMTIFMVNLFISLLNESFAKVKTKWNTDKAIEKFDEELNQHFWGKLQQLSNFFLKQG